MDLSEQSDLRNVIANPREALPRLIFLGTTPKFMLRFYTHSWIHVSVNRLHRLFVAQPVLHIGVVMARRLWMVHRLTVCRNCKLLRGNDRSVDNYRAKPNTILCYYLHVKKAKAVLRRRMSILNRKTLLSYYSPEEAQEIVNAARQQGVSISNFIATAALREAALVNTQKKKQ